MAKQYSDTLIDRLEKAAALPVFSSHHKLDLRMIAKIYRDQNELIAELTKRLKSAETQLADQVREIEELRTCFSRLDLLEPEDIDHSDLGPRLRAGCVHADTFLELARTLLEDDRMSRRKAPVVPLPMPKMPED